MIPPIIILVLGRPEQEGHLDGCDCEVCTINRGCKTLIEQGQAAAESESDSERD